MIFLKALSEIQSDIQKRYLSANIADGPCLFEDLIIDLSFSTLSYVKEPINHYMTIKELIYFMCTYTSLRLHFFFEKKA